MLTVSLVQKHLATHGPFNMTFILANGDIYSTSMPNCRTISSKLHYLSAPTRMQNFDIFGLYLNFRNVNLWIINFLIFRTILVSKIRTKLKFYSFSSWTNFWKVLFMIVLTRYRLIHYHYFWVINHSFRSDIDFLIIYQIWWEINKKKNISWWWEMSEV